MMYEEQQEQTALFHWAQIMEHKYPELALMYHIPNEGKRTKVSGAVLKSMGLKKGMPDICLPVPRAEYGALYIEMKAQNGVVTKDQKEYINALNNAGNLALVCRSWGSAANIIQKYIEGKIDEL